MAHKLNLMALTGIDFHPPLVLKTFNLQISMKRGTGSGLTLISGDKLICAAQIMNLLDEGCDEIHIIKKA